MSKFYYLLPILCGVLGQMCNITRAAELNCGKRDALGSSSSADDCESMGYTMDVYSKFRPFELNEYICGEGSVIHCPQDNKKVFCVPQSFFPILYGDGTLSKFILKDKTPIGIVFDEKNRLAVALSNIKADGTPGSEKLSWTPKYNDTPLTNCDNDDYDITNCDPDGRSNTDILLKITENPFPAPLAANKYEPAGCVKDFCKKGKWFVPSVGEFKHMGYFYLKINVTLGLLSLDKMEKTDAYWTSNEGNRAGAVCYVNRNSVHNCGRFSSNSYYVRPVVKY